MRDEFQKYLLTVILDRCVCLQAEINKKIVRSQRIRKNYHNPGKVSRLDHGKMKTFAGQGIQVILLRKKRRALLTPFVRKSCGLMEKPPIYSTDPRSPLGIQIHLLYLITMLTRELKLQTPGNYPTTLASSSMYNA
ncbi:hypothetical protein Y032_0083g1651 [Ancylostoma ceylanicum]|uniref:Uncharacterized protein n=1 Tax=Ancylostoma ceylanicum TaxID=53326 RepID=A0A016TR13_9BILA|nr:hypothetical protein Y032_0083g1651 [Ancylostoma ceylanicum]